MENDSLLLTLVNEVLGRPNKSNKHRGQHEYDCPICGGHSKMAVNTKLGVYKCWVCHESDGTYGSIKKLLSVLGGKAIWERAKKLGISFKVDKSRVVHINTEKVELPKGFTRFEDSNPNLMVHKEGWNYLTKQRKLSPETIYKHQIGYTTYKSESFDDNFTNRVIIPSYDKNGELNYFTARSWLPYSKMRYKNPDVPRETIIFNEHLINWDGTVYIVEGPLDHVVVHNSIPLQGKDVHDILIQTLMERCTGHVVILLDGEEKVWNTAKKIYSKINIGKLYGRVKIIKLRDGLDIGEVQEKYGRKGVVEALRTFFTIKESKL
jgi:DNA primase